MVKDENLKGNEKEVFKTISVMKYFTRKLKYNDLKHVSNVIFNYKKLEEKHYSLKEKKLSWEKFLGPCAPEPEHILVILMFTLFEPKDSYKNNCCRKTICNLMEWNVFKGNERKVFLKSF